MIWQLTYVKNICMSFLFRMANRRRQSQLEQIIGID